MAIKMYNIEDCLSTYKPTKEQERALSSDVSVLDKIPYQYAPNSPNIPKRKETGMKLLIGQKIIASFILLVIYLLSVIFASWVFSFSTLWFSLFLFPTVTVLMYGVITENKVWNCFKWLE